MTIDTRFADALADEQAAILEAERRERLFLIHTARQRIQRIADPDTRIALLALLTLVKKA